MKSIRKKLVIIFIVLSTINIGLIILQWIIHPTNRIYGSGRTYYWIFAILLAIMQILNIVLLGRILKKNLESDKKTFIKKLIIPIILLIITFFVPIHMEEYTKSIDLEPTNENSFFINGEMFTYDRLRTKTVKNIYEITIHKTETELVSDFLPIY